MPHCTHVAGRFLVAAAIMATSNDNSSNNHSGNSSSGGSVYGRATTKPTAAQYRAAVALCLPGDASPSLFQHNSNQYGGNSGRLATTLSARALAGFDSAVRNLQVTRAIGHRVAQASIKETLMQKLRVALDIVVRELDYLVREVRIRSERIINR